MFEYYDGFLGRRNSIPVNPDDLIRLRLQGLRWLQVAKQVPRIDGGVGISHNILSQANRVRESHEWRVALDDYWRRHHDKECPPPEMRKVLSYPSIENSETHLSTDSNSSSETQTDSIANDSQANNVLVPDPDTGLEVEIEDPRIEQPFNPEEIRVRTTNITVQLLVSRIGHNEIDLEPEFQRAFIWKTERQSRFIESLLLQIPIPVFYVAADESNNWSVVDGAQRLSAIYNNVTDEFPLNRLEYFVQLNGKSYSDLPRPMQRRIGETQLCLHIVEPGTSEDVRLNISRRINPRRFDVKEATELSSGITDVSCIE